MEKVHSASIFLSNIEHRWLFLAIALIVVALIVLTQDRSKGVTFLILLYAISFIAFLIPAFVKIYEKTVPTQDRFVLNIVFGALPIVALLVHKYKRAKKH